MSFFTNIFFNIFNPVQNISRYEDQTKIFLECCSAKKRDKPEKSLNFSQYSLVSQVLNDQEKHKNLYEIVKNYNGLCDIICNEILFKDSLGKTKDFNKSITLKKLEKISGTHVVKINNHFSLILAQYNLLPNTFFSLHELRHLTRKGEFSDISHLKSNPFLDPFAIISVNERRLLNQEVFAKGVQRIPVNETAKLIVYCAGFLLPSSSGHSILIKKTKKGKYIYFDPNQGEFRGLSLELLIDQINALLLQSSYTNIILLSREDSLKNPSV